MWREILGSHSGVAEDSSFKVCDAESLDCPRSLRNVGNY